VLWFHYQGVPGPFNSEGVPWPMKVSIFASNNIYSMLNNKC
jgi:hypothetical protein